MSFIIMVLKWLSDWVPRQRVYLAIYRKQIDKSRRMLFFQTGNNRDVGDTEKGDKMKLIKSGSIHMWTQVDDSFFCQKRKVEFGWSFQCSHEGTTLCEFFMRTSLRQLRNFFPPHFFFFLERQKSRVIDNKHTILWNCRGSVLADFQTPSDGLGSLPIFRCFGVKIKFHFLSTKSFSSSNSGWCRLKAWVFLK